MIVIPAFALRHLGVMAMVRNYKLTSIHELYQNISTFDPTECAGEEEEEEEISLAPEPEPNYNLSNFLRAREFFMTKSTKTGVSL